MMLRHKQETATEMTRVRKVGKTSKRASQVGRWSLWERMATRPSTTLPLATDVHVTGFVLKAIVVIGREGGAAAHLICTSIWEFPFAE